MPRSIGWSLPSRVRPWCSLACGPDRGRRTRLSPAGTRDRRRAARHRRGGRGWHGGRSHGGLARLETRCLRAARRRSGCGAPSWCPPEDVPWGRTRRHGPLNGAIAPAVPSKVPAIDVDLHLRWSDLDAYGHVNNVAIVGLLEQARVLAFWSDADPILPPLTSASESWVLVAECRRSSTSDVIDHRTEPIQAEVSVTKCAGASFVIGYRLLVDGESASPRRPRWRWWTPRRARRRASARNCGRGCWRSLPRTDRGSPAQVRAPSAWGQRTTSAP